MTWSVTSQGGATVNSGASVSISSLSIAAGSLIVVGSCENDTSGTQTPGTVTDSAGNTYTLLKSAICGTNVSQTAGVFFTITTTTVTSITYTLKVNGQKAAICAASATTPDSSPADASVTNSSSANTSTPSVTSGTASGGGELFVGFLGVCNNPITFTEDTTHGWTNLNSQQNTVQVNGNLAYQINAGTGALTYSPTINGTDNCADIVVAFKQFVLPQIPMNPWKRAYMRR